MLYRHCHRCDDVHGLTEPCPRAREDEPKVDKRRLYKPPPDRRVANRLRDELIRNSNGCAIVECGSFRNLEVDHIVPLAEGGLDARENLQVLCARCHAWKSDRERRRAVKRHWAKRRDNLFADFRKDA